MSHYVIFCFFSLYLCSESLYIIKTRYMKSWLPAIIGLIFVVYSYFGARYYACTVMQACSNQVDASPIATDATTAEAAAITFEWSNDAPLLNNEDSLLQAISSGLEEGQIVQITGHYFSEENNETAYENLGQARAEKVKALLAEMMEPQSIRTSSDMVDGTEEEHQNAFESVTFDVVEIDINKAEVLKLQDKVVILFADGARKKEPNPIIDGYLDQLAAELMESGNTVLLVGHTDMMGDSKTNYNLGLRRAKDIRDYLHKQGVSRKQIKTESMGEKDPVATNDTPAGRHQNRRVEITIQ